MSRHCVTIYKDVPNNGETAIIGKSHLIMLANIDVAAYTNIISILSDFFCKAEVYATHCKGRNPAHLSIIVHSSCLERYKQEDSDTLIYRLWWMIENFKSPTNGAVVSIYLNDVMDKIREYPWARNHLWQTKQTWMPVESTIISIQAHSEQQNVKNDPLRIHINESVEIIETIAKKLNYNIVYVDYTTSIDDLYDIMLTTKYHFSYTGSTGAFASLTRTPTIHIGHIGGGIGWNTWAGHRRQTLQTDPTTGQLILQEPSYYTAVNAGDPKYLHNLEQVVLSVL